MYSAHKANVFNESKPTKLTFMMTDCEITLTFQREDQTIDLTDGRHIKI